MDANGVDLVVIGLEEFGAEEFVELNFFEGGDVFVDKGKKTYQDLGYKRYNFLSIWVALFTKITRSAISAAKAQSIQGNLSGDGLQNGGTLIVAKGGEQVLLDHHENDIGDHVANEAILNALSLTEVTSPGTPVDKEATAKDVQATE